MLYELKERSDGSSYGFLESDEELTQSDMNGAIGRLRAAGIWDWNVDDIVDELSSEGFNVAIADIADSFWI